MAHETEDNSQDQDASPDKLIWFQDTVCITWTGSAGLAFHAGDQLLALSTLGLGFFPFLYQFFDPLAAFVSDFLIKFFAMRFGGLQTTLPASFLNCHRAFGALL
jgi:hypothetical protein